MLKQIKAIWTNGQEKKSLFKLFTAFVITAILMLLSSAVVGELTDSVFNTNSQAPKLLLVFIVLEASVLLLRHFTNILQTKTIQNMRQNIKQKTMNDLLNSPYEFSSKLEQGDLLGRLDHDVTSVVSASSISVELLKSVLILSILAVGMFIIDYRLLILFLIPLLITILVQYFVSKITAKFIMPWKIAMGKVNSTSQDIINNRTTVKLYQVYDTIISWLNDSLNESRNSGIKGIGTLYFIQTPLQILVILPMINVLIGGVYLVSINSISVSNFMSAFLISSLAFENFHPIVNAAQNIPHLLTSVERLLPIWEAGEEKFENEISNNKPVIKINNLSFAYDENPILKDISLTINEGELIGFVGESGSGKSTLFNLINGLYVPTSGEIFVKGLSVQKWDKQKFRQLFSVVAQKTYLMNTSIKNNLKYVNEQLSDNEIKQILQDVHLTKQIDDNVGERGQLLSGGERQRLSIARAIVNNSEILLFDEATSALDTTTEKVINEIINSGSQKTRLIIAHRLSSVAKCDCIYYLQNGQIIESGNHQQLMDLQGKYYDQVMIQKGENNEQTRQY